MNIDKFLKDKLSNLDGGDSMDTWDMLSDKMDTQFSGTPIEDQRFDLKVKDAIESISSIEMPAWNAFMPSLDLDENLQEIESDIALDNTVKSNLEDLTSAYNDSSWDLLEERLEELHHADLDNQDSNLDQVSYEKLLNFTVPQKAGDWEVLEKELDKEFILPYKLLFKYKLAEVAILASLILIFFQAKPLLDQHIAQNKIAKKAAISQSQELNKVESDQVLISGVAASRHDNRKVSAINNTAKAFNIKPNLQKESIPQDLSIIDKDRMTSSAQITPSKDKSALTPILANSDNSNSILANTVTAVVKSKNEQIPVQDTPPTFIEQIEEETLSTYGSGSNISKLPTTSIMNIPFIGQGVTACLSCTENLPILTWRLGAHIDAAYTVILTPFDKIFNLESYNHSTIGYGAGLSTSILLGKWELESGFKYSTRTYKPETLVQNIGNIVTGYLQVELNKIEMNLLTVPLNLRYHFSDKLEKTHFYMHGGASMHVATQTYHFIESDFVGNNKRPDHTDSKVLLDESDFSDKIFASGWFDGGSFIENRYFTFNIGMGLERKISSRYSIFGQTTYAQFLNGNGLGPNNDRFNSFEFSTGIRALFK